MEQKRTVAERRISGSKEFVTLRSTDIIAKKPLEGFLKNKSEHGLGISFKADMDPEAETVLVDKHYEINLHFSVEAVDSALEPFIGREQGLCFFTFSATCRHTSLNLSEGREEAGFELEGSIPAPIMEFLRKETARA